MRSFISHCAFLESFPACKHPIRFFLLLPLRTVGHCDLRKDLSGHCSPPLLLPRSNSCRDVIACVFFCAKRVHFPFLAASFHSALVRRFSCCAVGVFCLIESTILFLLLTVSWKWGFRGQFCSSYGATLQSMPFLPRMPPRLRRMQSFENQPLQLRQWAIRSTSCLL